jgi:hypothetical protein
MTDALDPEPLLRAPHETGVRHIIIGGFAVNANGEIRPSRDLALVPIPRELGFRFSSRLSRKRSSVEKSPMRSILSWCPMATTSQDGRRRTTPE